MNKPESKKFAVMMISGTENDAWRAIMGFTFISTLLVYGHHVTVFFGGNGIVWCQKDPPKIEHPPFKTPIAVLEEIIESPNAEIIICTNCTETCTVGESGRSELRDDIPLGGMSTIMHQAAEGDVLTF